MEQSLAAAGRSQVVTLRPGERADYAVSGTFTGFVGLYRALEAGDDHWQLVTMGAADTGFSGSLANQIDQPERVVRYCFEAFDTDDETAWTGTADVSFTPDPTAIVDVLVRDRTGRPIVSLRADDALDLVGGVQAPLTSDGVGAKNGATVTAVERGNSIVHKTVLSLAATPISLADDAGVGQYGGVKVYDFPAGNILVLGAVLNAVLTLTETAWKDAAEGDVGLGTTVVDDGDALATTEQNIIATTAIAALAAQTGPLTAQSAAAPVPLAAAGGTDTDLYLNVRIDDDAAHAAGGGTITGTLTLVWVNLGDF